MKIPNYNMEMISVMYKPIYFFEHFDNKNKMISMNNKIFYINDFNE